MVMQLNPGVGRLQQPRLESQIQTLRRPSVSALRYWQICESHCGLEPPCNVTGHCYDQLFT